MPAVVTSPYPSADTVLNLTRSLGTDAIQSLAGNLLANSKATTGVFLNAGYRYLQVKLAIAGYSTLKKTVQLFSLTPAVPIDPGTRTALSYTGYFNGSTNAAAPILPPDLCWPLRLRERPTGSLNQFRDMFANRDGLSSRQQSSYLRDWIWENDQLIFNGSNATNDIELYYVPFLPDLSVTTSPTSQVLLVRSENALAAYTLWQYAISRNPEHAQEALQMGDMYAKLMLSSDAMQKARGNYRRRGYSRGLHAGWGRY